MNGEVSLLPELLKIGGMLSILLAVIIGLLFMLKKFSSMMKGSDNSMINLVYSFYLGNRERLVLIDVDGKRLLLGVTQNSVNTLFVFDSKDEIEVMEKAPGDKFVKIFKSKFGNAGLKNEK